MVYYFLTKGRGTTKKTNKERRSRKKKNNRKGKTISGRLWRDEEQGGGGVGRSCGGAGGIDEGRSQNIL